MKISTQTMNQKIKNMKNYNVYVSVLLLFLMINQGCTKDDKLHAGVDAEIIFDETDLGNKQREMYDKYDVLFQYKWDRNAFARNAVADPANVEDVLPYMEIMEELFFKAFDSVATNPEFGKVQTPLTVFLIGSGINYGGSEAFGESTVGQAGNIQPNRLTLGGLNTFGTLLRRKNADTQFLNMIYEAAVGTSPNQAGLIGFLYHEYAHYLNTRFDIPTTFALAAAANYLKGTNAYQSVDNETAFSKGFFIPYGMQNEMEDFATYVQIMVWKSPEEIRSRFIKSEASQIKYNEVNKFFDELGIDLNALREYLQKETVKDRILAIKRKYEN